MGMVYLPTWMVDFYGKYNIPYMDPMGSRIYFFETSHPQVIGFLGEIPFWKMRTTPGQLLICSLFSRENGHLGCSWMLITKHQPAFLGHTLPKTNSSPLQMDGWNTILSYWVSAYFQGLLLLVSGRVSIGSLGMTPNGLQVMNFFNPPEFPFPGRKPPIDLIPGSRGIWTTISPKMMETPFGWWFSPFKMVVGKPTYKKKWWTPIK